MKDKQVRAQYTPEFKLEAVRQVHAGQAIGVVAKILGMRSGYKVHVTETCEATAANFITHVETRPAMEPDMNAMAAIHAKLAQRDLLPKEHFVDSGYVNAELLVTQSA